MKRNFGTLSYFFMNLPVYVLGQGKSTIEQAG